MLEGHYDSYLSPKAESRELPQKGGYGIFAVEPIPAGEIIAVWGGIIVNGEELATLVPEWQMCSVQVEEDKYLVSTNLGPADRVNHCCDPNAGLSGQIGLIAMRDITAGEEICFDYAMSDSSPYDEFTCGCGAANCRVTVTGNDWRSPALWERYDGYFSPYLQRRINQLKRDLGG